MTNEHISESRRAQIAEVFDFFLDRGLTINDVSKLFIKHVAHVDDADDVFREAQDRNEAKTDASTKNPRDPATQALANLYGTYIKAMEEGKDDQGWLPCCLSADNAISRHSPAQCINKKLGFSRVPRICLAVVQTASDNKWHWRFKHDAAMEGLALPPNEWGHEIEGEWTDLLGEGSASTEPTDGKEDIAWQTDGDIRDDWYADGEANPDDDPVIETDVPGFDVAGTMTGRTRTDKPNPSNTPSRGPAKEIDENDSQCYCSQCPDAYEGVDGKLRWGRNDEPDPDDD